VTPFHKVIFYATPLMGSLDVKSFASGNVRGFHAKKKDRMWLCTSVTLAPTAVESCSKAQKTSSLLVCTRKKIFWPRVL